MPPTVFISYSHSDARWKDALALHLGVLEREGLIAAWHDGLIRAGADWLPAVRAAMVEARVAIFIVSVHFLNSKFVRREEIPALMERRRKEGLQIIPLIARPCAWQKVPWLAAIQARPLDGKSLAELGGARAEKVLSTLAEDILGSEERPAALSLHNYAPTPAPPQPIPGPTPAAAPPRPQPSDNPHSLLLQYFRNEDGDDACTFDENGVCNNQMHWGANE